MQYIGIDPGISGGCAIITDAEQVIDTFAWSTARDAADRIREAVGIYPTLVMPWNDTKALLEQVSAMPKQGVSSTFKFGTNYGTWIGILSTLGISFETLRPHVWMAGLGLRGKKRDPWASRRRAQELYPQVKVTHAIADALLLAEVCRRRHVQP